MKYIVKIDNIYSNYLEVEADDQLSAIDKAYDFYEHNKQYVRKLKDHYYGTMPKQHWHAILKEEMEAIAADVDKINKTKSDVSYLIHRAQILDRRNAIHRKNSIVGQLEKFMLKKELLKVDDEIKQRNIQLTDEHKEEFKKLLEVEGKTNPLIKPSLLEYIDPSIKNYTADTEEEENRLRELSNGDVEIKVLEDGNIEKNITTLKDRDPKNLLENKKNYLTNSEIKTIDSGDVDISEQE